MATAKRGRPRKILDPKVVSVRFDAALHRKLAIVAASRGVSLNDLVTTGLADWLRKQPEMGDATRLAKRRKPS